MCLRLKLTSFRSILALFAVGLVFLSVNLLLLWNQQLSATQNICVCEPSFNVHNINDKREKRSKVHETIEIDKATSVEGKSINIFNTSKDNDSKEKTIKKENLHQLAVVVPFRNRYEEMMKFVPHIHKFLERQNVSHQVWVINQVDKHRYR